MVVPPFTPVAIESPEYKVGLIEYRFTIEPNTPFVVKVGTRAVSPFALPDPSRPAIPTPPPAPPIPEFPPSPPCPTTAINTDFSYKNTAELFDMPIIVYSTSLLAVKSIVDVPPSPPLCWPLELTAPAEAFILSRRGISLSLAWN